MHPHFFCWIGILTWTLLGTILPTTASADWPREPVNASEVTTPETPSPSASSGGQDANSHVMRPPRRNADQTPADQASAAHVSVDQASAEKLIEAYQWYLRTAIPVEDKDRARRHLNAIESWLFRRLPELCDRAADLKDLADALADTQDELVAANLEDAQAPALAMQQRLRTDTIVSKLETLQEILGFDPCKKHLYRDFRFDEPWGFQFSAGYEYVNLGDLFRKGTPTLDLLIHRDFRTPSRWRWMPQFFIHTELSNAGEALAALTGTGDPNGDDEEPPTPDPTTEVDGMAESSSLEDGDAFDLETALRVDISLFFPWFRLGGESFRETADGRLRLRRGSKRRDVLGLFLDAGFLEFDSRQQTRSRYYAGLRLAYNPEWYFDALLGRTEGLDSNRLELRGQFPITRTSDNSRIYLGMIANLGLNEVEGSLDEDVVRIYVKWNVDLKSFFENLGSGD